MILVLGLLQRIDLLVSFSHRRMQAETILTILICIPTRFWNTLLGICGDQRYISVTENTHRHRRPFARLVLVILDSICVSLEPGNAGIGSPDMASTLVPGMSILVLIHERAARGVL